MARKTVYRNLPSLEEVLGRFTGMPSRQSHQQAIAAMLRKVAKKLRNSKPQPFYSMREAARFFGAPLGTISIVYQTLEREGIINRIRSSQTMLAGKAVLPRDSVRGVVGLPIWLHSMVLLPYTRTFAMEIEERLRRSGYVADFIFHVTKEDEADPEFAMRLLRHRLDVVVFHNPLATSRQNLLSLRERGVRVLVIQRNEARADLPAVIYLQNYLPAYRKLALRWHQAGIRKVWLWSPMEALAYKAEAETFRAVFQKQGLELETINDVPAQLLNKIRQRKSCADSAVAFIDSTHSEEICNREPQLIEQISRHARIGFCVGRVRVPYLQSRNIKADVVEHSASELAGRLADDICRLSIIPDGYCHTFVAQYEEQVAL